MRIDLKIQFDLSTFCVDPSDTEIGNYFSNIEIVVSGIFSEPLRFLLGSERQANSTIPYVNW